MSNEVSTVIIALFASLPATIAAIVVGLQSRWASNERAATAAATAAKADVKADTIIQKAVEIHTLTNSQLSSVTSALAIANTKIEGLDKLVTELLSAKSATLAKLSPAAAKTKAKVTHG